MTFVSALLLALLTTTVPALSQKQAGFSVSPTCVVTFAPGNLQYLAATDSFRFAPKQYDMIGYANDSIAQDCATWIDLLGWATSGFDNTQNDPLAIHFQPWDWTCELGAELDYERNQFGYGPSQNMPSRHLTGPSAEYDWGVHRRIDDYPAGTWRTLTRQEWRYLLTARPHAAKLQKTVEIEGVTGLLLLPDSYADSLTRSCFPIPEKTALNDYPDAVFLPMAGARYHLRTTDVGKLGGYWTSSSHDQAGAYYLAICQAYNAISTELYGRHTGRSVRLVRNIQGSAAIDSEPLSDELCWTNANQLQLINELFPGEKPSPYARYPLDLKDKVVPGFWNNGLHSAGLAIRFASNSLRIAARYRLLNNFRMAHMADTGIKGTDLYILDDNGKWQYVNTARPRGDTLQYKIFTEAGDGRMHEYMLYLPLYDGIRWLEIGIDSAATICKPQVENPRSKGKIVFYGTSIMQGGCASRTGMVATSIIQRQLGVECCNMAISGYGRMWLDVANKLAQQPDVAAYVLDPLPNCTMEMTDTLTYQFVRTFLEGNPEAAVIMVACAPLPSARFDMSYHGFIQQRNDVYHRDYLRLLQEYPDRLYYVEGEALLGRDNEGSVDGNHLTDYGFQAYADILLPVLRQALANQSLARLTHAFSCP